MAAGDNADMFATMRITMGIERAQADDGSAYQPIEVLRAGDRRRRALPRAAQTTSACCARARSPTSSCCAPTDLNMAPLNVTDGQVVLCAQPSNVDTVFIDGSCASATASSLGIDPAAVVRDATAAVAGLRERVGVPLT